MNLKNENLKRFGNLLNELRVKKQLSLREICKLTNYDSSNWSKIERGVLSPPSDKMVLTKWAKTLGLKTNREIEEFIDDANVAQGIIPQDILSGKMVEHLPAFFRTLRNKKPTKEEIDKLIELLRNS